MQKQIKRKINKQSGAAMLISVIFFLFISLAIIVGLVGPTVREFRNANVNLNSKKSYFLAESGGEDASYRIIKNMMIEGSETLVLDSNSATTIITSTGNTKEINSLGDVLNYERRIFLSLGIGDGVSFNYGVQAGTGGFYLKENATINGNVYSNGNIVGENNSLITGSAVAASSSALLADQLNDTPTTPPNSIVFRNADSTQDFAQSFALSVAGQISKVRFYIKKNSTPGDATVKIVSDNNGTPSTTVLASGTLYSSLVTSNYGWVDINFSSSPQLSASVTYWVVIDNSSSNSSKYYTIGANSSYADGQAKVGRFSSTWNSSSLDGYFSIYTGGLTSTISGTTVGTGLVGDAWAHTVDNTTIRGSLYCQTGSGNNKVCNTSKSDPTAQDLPISDGNIAEWKAQAEAGEIISGDYVLAQSGSLGPNKITGNLTVQGDKILTVTGTLWVVGNILVDNHSEIRLSSSYGGNSGIILADGTVTTTNNSVLAGSGQAGSYLMLISESSSANAIKLDNNVQGGILYARNGTIDFENNAGAVQVSAYKIELENNTIIDYESGLINPIFSSGPSGGWNVQSWKETQ